MSVPIPGDFGYGTMSLTWRNPPLSTEDAADMIHYAVTNHGIKFINGGEFYGPDNINLKAIQRFLVKYDSPKNKDLVVSIKGCVDTTTLSPTGDQNGVETSLKNVLPFFAVENRPKLIFEPARVDLKVPIELTVSYINEFVQLGQLTGISLSETGGKTITKAITAAPISCVELELSIFARDIIEEGALKVCSQNNIPIIAYSPLGRGLLTDYAVEHSDELYKKTFNDVRSHIDWFKEENFKQNIAVAKKLYDFAHNEKKTSLESLALSWILKVSESSNLWGIDKVTKIVPIPSGSSKKSIDLNFGHLVKLTDDDFEAIEKIYKELKLAGLRANEHWLKNMLV